MMPHFQDPAAQRAWDRYFSEVRRWLRPVDPAQGRDLLAELEAHLADSFASIPSDRPELSRLEEAISRLGRPSDYLRPVLADGLLERGTRGFRPVSLLRGLYHSLWLGTRMAAIGTGFGVGYLTLAVLIGLSLLKPFWPSHVGMFRTQTGFTGLGALSDVSGAHDVLGWWFEPLAISAATALYFFLTWALRALRRKPAPALDRLA